MSWDETIEQITQKYQEQANFDTYKYLKLLMEHRAELDNIAEVVTIIETLRDDLDRSDVDKSLKVQIILDILEVVFRIYHDHSPGEIAKHFFSIFEPMDYAKQIFHLMEKRVAEYEQD